MEGDSFGHWLSVQSRDQALVCLSWSFALLMICVHYESCDSPGSL